MALKFPNDLLNYIQACIFTQLNSLFNFHVKRTVIWQDFGAKFNPTHHNGVPVADILKNRFETQVNQSYQTQNQENDISKLNPLNLLWTASKIFKTVTSYHCICLLNTDSFFLTHPVYNNKRHLNVSLLYREKPMIIWVVSKLVNSQFYCLANKQ